MKISLCLSLVFSATLATAYPWYMDGSMEEFEKRTIKGLKVIERDPELVTLIRDMYKEQLQERDDYLASLRSATEEATCLEKRTNSSASTASCLQHPLKDFYPSTVAGLTRFPEAAYPYQDPKPSDQRGPCPGLNTMANHGYVPRSGIVTVAQTLVGAKRLFNMGVDLTAFLAGGSVLFAGDLPTMTYSIGGADARTNSLGVVGGALGTETGLSGHLRFKEGDVSGTRCDFYLCNGDNHNLNSSIFLNLQSKAKSIGNGQYNVAALSAHTADQYKLSRSTNPYFYFFPPQAALAIGATYFITGFFSNGTIGAGGVANEASIASFLGAQFNSDGSVSYVPEQIPPQGWYRRGTPMFLTEGIDGIITLYTGAATILGNPLLFGANTGTAGNFTSAAFGLGAIGGTTSKGLSCAIEQGLYGNFINEFNGLLSGAFGTLASIFGSSFGCPTPTGAPPYEAAAATAPGYPKPSPCTLNRQQNGLDQCAPATNTYARFNTGKTPFCLNSPRPSPVGSNPLPAVAPFS